MIDAFFSWVGWWGRRGIRARVWEAFYGHHSTMGFVAMGCDDGMDGRDVHHGVGWIGEVMYTRLVGSVG